MIVIFCFFGENYSTWLKSVTNDQKNDPIDSGRKAKAATGYTQGTIHLRRQHVLGGGVSPFANGQKVTVHKDQKSPS